MSMVLDTTFHIWFIMTVYYKMQKMLLQNATAILLQNATVLLEHATVISKCDVYYQSRQCMLLREMDKALDVLTWKYDNIFLMSDFNAEPADTAVSDFC